MSAIVNARDVLLQAASPRLLPIPGANIKIATTSPVFQVAVGGTSTPTSISVTATLTSVEGVVTFSCVGGTLSSISGNTCALLYTDMSSNTATISATITYRGQVYNASSVVSKVFDGATGTTGSNGTNGTNGSNGSDGASAVASQISSSTALFTADSTGLIDTSQTFPTTMTVMLGVTNDTANWTITRASSDASITTTLSGALVTVTGMGTSVDSGYVDVTATRTGYATQVVRMIVSKAKRSTPASGVVANFGGMDSADLVVGATSVAGFKLLDTGRTQQREAGVYVDSGAWYDPITTGIGTGRSVRVYLTGQGGGTVAGVTLSTWVSLSSGINVTLTKSSLGMASASFTVQVSEDGGATVAGIGYATLEAEWHS